MINQNNLAKEIQEVREKLRTASLALGVSLQSMTDVFMSVSQNLILKDDLREALRKHAEDMRWQHDPLEIQARFIEPVVANFRGVVVWGLRAASEGLNALADWVEEE